MLLHEPAGRGKPADFGVLQAGGTAVQVDQGAQVLVDILFALVEVVPDACVGGVDGAHSVGVAGRNGSHEAVAEVVHFVVGEFGGVG